jgi:hypothetical protein
MFIQIMNRMMNEAIFHPVAGDVPGRIATVASGTRSQAAERGPQRAPLPKATASRAGAVPAAFRIYASAFNTAVHGG